MARTHISTLLLVSAALLLSAVAKVVLAAAALGFVCGPRYMMDPVEWTVSDVIEKIRKLALGNTL